MLLGKHAICSKVVPIAYCKFRSLFPADLTLAAKKLYVIMLCQAIEGCSCRYAIQGRSASLDTTRTSQQ